MVYGFIFLGLLLACIGLGIANSIVKRVRNKKSVQNKEQEGD